jgi:hypothetical protein
MSFADAGLGHGDDLRTVDHFMGILAEDRELRHLSLEGGQHVIFILDVLLPIASGARIYRLWW